MKGRPRKLIMGILLTVVLAAEAIASWNGVGLTYRLYAGRPYHFREVKEGVLYRDGFRNPIQFQGAVHKAEPKTIVSVLADDEIKSERFAPTMAEIAHEGIRLECLNISEHTWPTTEAIQRFLNIVSDPERQPVLVHCREGVRRTGMIVAAYQMSILGYSKQQAKDAIEHFDHTGRALKDLQRFIDLYDPATRSVMYDPDSKPEGLE